MENYVAIHLHTELSLLDSCTNYKLYVDKAVELGQKAIAFTEHGNIYNWVEKKIYCDKNNIKYIHGVEIYLTEKLEPKVRDNYHTILLAKNYEGLKEINTLVDLSTQEDHFYYKPRITFDEFLSISENVIKISACLASPLNRLSKELQIFDSIAKHYDYFEVQPHVASDDQKKYNVFLLL
jgi:DNA polymerase-3 subunit alpha